MNRGQRFALRQRLIGEAGVESGASNLRMLTDSALVNSD